MLKKVLSVVCVSLLFISCKSKNDSSNNRDAIDEELGKIIYEHNLAADPRNGLNLPSIEGKKAQLGMKLFFTKALGGQEDAACASCHHPMLGGGDNLSLPIGAGADIPELLGIGRTHSATQSNYDHGYALVARNAPSTYNVALWTRSLFWDGRIEKIDGGISTPDSGYENVDVNAGANLAVAQARFPVVAVAEMRGPVFEANQSHETAREHLALRLTDTNASDYIPNSWQNEFTDVYGQNSVTFANIVDAIGEYERSQVFVNTPWRSYVDGNTSALSLSAKRGAKLFFSSYENGGMNCVACHAGTFFTDEKFHVMAIPQVGEGKESNYDDLGRYAVDHNTTHKYAFRTQTLYNIELTGPWGHDGAYTTLKGVVSHMVNPDKAIEEYDYNQLDSNVKTENSIANTQRARSQLNDNRSSGISPHKNVNATEDEINDLVAFLKSLTDPCLKDRGCIGKWIPDNTSVGEDGLRLNAEDRNGNLL